MLKEYSQARKREKESRSKGGRAWGNARRVMIAAWERRCLERRKRDVEAALSLGVSPRFHSVCEDYIHQRGEFSNG